MEINDARVPATASWRSSVRRWLVECGPFVVMFLPVALLLYLSKPQGPDIRPQLEQFDAIQYGMTQSQVEALLGCRPGFYACPPELIFNVVASHTPSLRQENWFTPEVRIVVRFDGDGKVYDKFKYDRP